jgi:hypothetical protein
MEFGRQTPKATYPATPIDAADLLEVNSLSPESPTAH